MSARTKTFARLILLAAATLPAQSGNVKSAHDLSVPRVCTTTNSGNAYSCTTAPSFTPSPGDSIMVNFNAANTGSVTLNVNSTAADAIYKLGGTTALVSGDLAANHWVSLILDSSGHWQLEGQIANAPSDSGNVSASGTFVAGDIPTTTNTSGTAQTDSGVNISGTGKITTPQQTTPDTIALRPGSGATNPTYSQGWEGPAAPTAGAILFRLPNAAPTANQSMMMAAPSGGVSQVSWGGPFAATGVLNNVQVLTSGSGATYTPTSGTTAILAVLIGAGGGGGGATYTSSSDWANGGGGGCGAVVQYFVSGISSGQTGTYTVSSSGGTAGANTGGTGGTGTSTTFAWNSGTTITAGGGAGGVGETYGTSVAMIAGGAGGTGSNGTINGAGGAGEFGYRASGTAGWSGNGCSNGWGGSVGLSANGAGNAGSGYGAGGGGGVAHSAAEAGGAGAPGLLVIYEYL
ncbi:MAG: hypothetical protein ACLQG3_14465 [Terracidiphilus sp.]